MGKFEFWIRVSEELAGFPLQLSLCAFLGQRDFFGACRLYLAGQDFSFLLELLNTLLELLILLHPFSLLFGCVLLQLSDELHQCLNLIVLAWGFTCSCSLLLHE